MPCFSQGQVGSPIANAERHRRRMLIQFDIRIEHNSFEDVPWITRLVEFTQQVLAQDRVRIVGVCFGHQIVGRALGVKVGRSDQGWEVAVWDIDLTEEGKEVFGLEKLVRVPTAWTRIMCIWDP